jgi:transcriptional regulator with XRE-family HTH domain
MLPYATNVRRLMARNGMTLAQLVEASGLHGRTIKAILSGTSKPHARTLHLLAAGLGVSADELFQNPSLLAHRLFDRRTNPAVQDVVDSHPELFEGWTETDLPSRTRDRPCRNGTYTTSPSAISHLSRKKKSPLPECLQ